MNMKSTVHFCTLKCYVQKREGKFKLPVHLLASFLIIKSIPYKLSMIYHSNHGVLQPVIMLDTSGLQEDVDI